ncbi:MAG: FkbM family methyltransferase [Pseudomonadales bacterium]|nr:FkbM family methyltransferase [Pseudomonadales bacterium]
MDVGSNLGLYSLAFAKSGLFDRVIAFEPNPGITKCLADSDLPNVEIRHIALSDSLREDVLKVPVQSGRSLSGWASLEDNIDLETDEFETHRVKTMTLDSLELRGCTLIKIDVEGHELSMLNGAREFFQENRPTCLIEIREHHYEQVARFFDDLDAGYRELGENELSCGITPGNHVFVAGSQ